MSCLVVGEMPKPLSEQVGIWSFVLVDVVCLDVVFWICSLCYLIAAKSNEWDEDDGDTTPHCRDGERTQRLSVGRFGTDVENSIIVEGTVIDCFYLEVTGSSDGIDVGNCRFDETSDLWIDLIYGRNSRRRGRSSRETWLLWGYISID